MENFVILRNSFIRFFSVCLLGLAMATGLQAQTVVTHNIGTQGDLNIPGGSSSHYIITGSTTTNKVVVNSGYTGNITLRNVSIQSLAANVGTSTYSPFTVLGQNNRSNLSPVTVVNIILEGTNELLYTGSGYACLQVNQGAQIHISAIDPNDNSSGILSAKATPYVPGVGYSVAGAGIGAPGYGGSPTVAYNQGSSTVTGAGCSGTKNTAGGNIIISSGTVTAWGGHGAGIGGGFQTYYNGIILIYGGIVEARAGYDAAGIGSGCPTGLGVEHCYADNSAVIALPPAQIVAYGAGANADGGVGMLQFPELGLTGAKTLIYLNDLNKSRITVRTEDYTPDADIYLDFTQIAGLASIFNSLNINYDLTKVRAGRTNSGGIFQFRAELQQSTTFYTDASSANPSFLGRPFMPVVTTVTGNAANEVTVTLPRLATNISFVDYPSTPLLAGYTSSEAKQNAYCIKVSYNDATPMTNVTYSLQGGEGTDFASLIFLGSDSSTVIPTPPATLNNGTTFFIVIPVEQSKPVGIYSDVLLINGNYGGPLPGYIRRVVQQRVVVDDSQNNTYIKVAASPNQFTTTYPTSNTVTLNLDIDHSGTSVLYDPLDIVAKYLITTEPNYASALAANPLNTWSSLNIPLTSGSNINTTVDFSSVPAGKYYIHWHVESGVFYAHSLDVISPPAPNGGFGPYQIGACSDLPTVLHPALAYWQHSIVSDDLESEAGASTTGVVYTLKWYEGNGTTAYNGTSPISTTTVGLSTFYVSQENSAESCESDQAPVKVLIVKPQSLQYMVCAGTRVETGVEGITGINFYWYEDESGGMALSGPSNTFTISSATLTQTIWVEPREVGGSTIYPRLPIIINVNQNCNEVSACMSGGTLLYKEDFGGNDVLDPRSHPTGLPPGFSQLDYSATGKSDGFYSLVKSPNFLYPPEFYSISDHTHFPDSTRGYFMFLDPPNGGYNMVLYQSNIEGLCDNMNLSFSAWFMNVNRLPINETPPGLIVMAPKFQLQILDQNTGSVLASTNVITVPHGPQWQQYGFDFKLPTGVTGITFRILNKENLSNGNDWGMDDIEIRFCAPDVFVSLDDVLTECEGSSLTLSGTYSDNGTFGNNLVYRWERSSTGNINNPAEWSVVFGSEKSVSDGKVASSHTIPSLTTGKEGYYRLVVSNPSKIDTWACRAASKIIELKVILKGSSLVWTPEVNAGNDKQNWNNPDNWTPAVQPSACHVVYIPGNSSHYPVLTDDEKGVCGDIYFIQGAELGRPDLLTYERAYIQYNFGLWKESQITNQDDPNLVLTNSSTLNRMQYSASTSTPLSRERWYILSSPLQGVVTSDLSFGSFPLTFLKKFDPVKRANQNYSVGNWTATYTSMIEPIMSSMTDGFAFYMYGYDPEGNADRNFGCEESGSFNNPAYNDLSYLPTVRNGRRYGIEKTNGILELPFFADSDSTGLYAHRTQVYNSTSNESTFYAVSDGMNNPANFNKLTGTSVSISREPNGGNYRFATEEYNSGRKKWEFQPQIYHTVTGLSNGDEILLGNPYMSSIDMVKFCQDNISSIHSSFRIWDGVGFVDYSVNTTTGEITSSTGSYAATDRFVAPLQGFVVASTGKGTILFDVTNVSTVRPSEASSNLRSAVESVEYNTLRIKAENDVAASDAVIKYNEGATNTFMRGKDMQKLFSPNNYVPEIYSLAGEIPSSIQFVNNNGEINIPLGIRTGRRAELNLTFTGMDNYVKASKIELIDAQENLTIDLTGKSSYTYTFNHTDAGVNIGTISTHNRFMQVLQDDFFNVSNGRFSLRFQNSMTSLSEVPVSDDLKVYGDSQGIYVISSESDPIQQVIVYDFQGRSVYESKSGAKFYPMQRNLMNSPLIVKVVTKNGTKMAKLVVSCK